jgi:alcohol dehydrogenase
MLMPMENATRLGEFDEADAGLWCALGTFLVPYGGLLAANLKAGEIVLISGATSHFGSAAVALALAMGAGCVVALGRNKTVLEDLLHRFGSRVVTVLLTGDEDMDQKNMRQAA